MTPNSRMGWVPYAVALVGIVVSTLFASPGLPNLVGGHNDFLMLYSGGRLSGTPNLYDPDSMQKTQLEVLGLYGPSQQFSRLPFYAALLRPFSHFPYRTAYLLWQGVCFAALVGFIALWRMTPKAWTAATCCWSLPLWFNFIRAQDLTVVLLPLAAAIRLREAYPFAAGLILSLCGIKYHLFVLAPLLIAIRREWRFGAGAAAGGLVLIAGSFALAGLRWPIQYLAVIGSPAIAPFESSMPNLHGLLLGAPHRAALEAFLTLGVVCAVSFIVRTGNFEYGMAAMLIGGLLVSYHAYVDDCVLLIPALLAIQKYATERYLRDISLFLCTPFAYLYLLAQKPFSWFLTAALLLLLAAMCHALYRARPATEAIAWNVSRT